MPELHLVAIVCEKKSETATKHNLVKNYPFSAGNTQNGVGFFGGKSEKFGVFGVLGPFRPPNSAKLFLGQPHYSALGGGESPQFFSDLKWVQNCAKPRFIEIEIEKSRFLIEKNSTPNYPKIGNVPGPPAVHCSGGAHWCPSKCPAVSKKSKKKSAGTASSCIFLREKVRNSVFAAKVRNSVFATKNRVTWPKITLFWLAIPNMAGV